MRNRFALFVPCILVALALVAHAADRKGRKVDLVWTAPDIASRPLTSIAMFPIATYDHNLEVEKLVAGMWGQSLKDAGYRWISAPSARSILQSVIGDSLVSATQLGLVKTPRIDSLAAPRLCGALRASAILTALVERWEQQPIEWNQSGKPTTTIAMRAALVDSTGRLLWSASSTEVGEGPYHDPSMNPIGVSGGDLGSQPITGQGGPPAYTDVATRLFTRWAAQFPSRPAARASQ